MGFVRPNFSEAAQAVHDMTAPCYEAFGAGSVRGSAEEGAAKCRKTGRLYCGRAVTRERVTRGEPTEGSRKASDRMWVRR